MSLNVTAASTAPFSTWVFVENLGLLFDAGDGVSASLGQKSRKARHIFVTHADRDHMCGLLQLHQLNARDGSPRIYYPKDCGTFPALRDFCTKFDPQSGPATWIGLKAEESVELENGFSINARTSSHVVAGNLCKALDYTVSSSRRILRSEFRTLPGSEIAAKRKELGDDAVTEIVSEDLLGYSGDAPKLEPNHWLGVKVLFHEATFLDPDTARGAHSNVPQVIEAAAELDLEALILLHFSARYSADNIEQAICDHAEAHSPRFPIHAVLPGQLATDILSNRPVWQPSDKP